MSDSNRNPNWPRVVGTVVKKTIRVLEDDYHATVQVEYEVDGTVYRHKEALELALDPASTAKNPCLPAFAVYEGDEVEVRYDPARPKRACLPQNELSADQTPYLYLKQHRPEPQRNPAWAASCAVGTVVHREGALDETELYCLIDVEFEAAEQRFRHREVLCATFEGAAQTGPRGQTIQRPVLDAHVGDGVIVCFDPAQPKRAYLRDNVLSPAQEEANEAAAKQRKVRAATPVAILAILLLLLFLM